MTDNSRVRVSIVGVVVVALFGALFARLWFLQVASGATFSQAAASNSIRVVPIEPLRGRILDRNGKVLVENRVAKVITVRRDLSSTQLTTVLHRLVVILGRLDPPAPGAKPVTLATLRQRYQDPRVSLYKPAVVASDVPDSVVVYVKEHQELFPGVEAAEIPTRYYPNGTLAAHLLGYVGEINTDELKAHRGQGYALGDTIGRSGVEAAFEGDLRGTPGYEKVEVGPDNRQVGPPVATKPARPGHDVELSLDLGVQQVAEDSLAKALVEARARVDHGYTGPGSAQFPAPAGSVVVLDARTGSVVALASNPTFDPNQFIGGIPTPLWDYYNDPRNHYPLTDRALQGQYAPGSTFKLVTSLAMLRQGVRSAGQWYDDQGQVVIRGQTFRNSGHEVLGPVDLTKAITRSSDAYFYEVGYDLWKSWAAGDTTRGNGIQEVARELGFGSPTGIALDEAAGRVPDAAWKKAFAAQLYSDPQQRAENSVWLPGDNVQAAVGQGDVLVTPLQLADAYATFANGGELFRPRIARAVLTDSGKVVRRIAPDLRRRVDIPAAYRAPMLAGFEGAVGDPQGTAYNAFAGFPLALVPVAGKTGTAQVAQKHDTSVFVGFVPATGAPGRAQYVVAAVVEQAGFGSEVAAPLVRRVMEKLEGLPVTPLQITTGAAN